MRRDRQILVVAVLTLMLGVTGTVAGAHAGQSVLAIPEVEAAVSVFDAWVEHRVAHEELPGASVGLVYDQELFWAKGYGYADLDKRTPATPSTAYRIASLTKLFTATATLHLRDAGKLRLDDPVREHLDWFEIKDEHPESPVVTIRHFLTHTSGLPRELDTLYWDDMAFPDREEFAELLSQSHTILPREEDFKYSNVAFAVLGHVVESVSGEFYAEYVTEHILRPLGMTGTEVLPEPEMPSLATGYKYRRPGEPREKEPFTDKAAMAAAGNMASTVEDLAKFLALQFRDGPAGGAQILKGSTLRGMRRAYWLSPDWTSGRGLGWGLARVGDQVRIRHGGYVPGHTSSITTVTDEKFGVIVLVNAGDGAPSAIAGRAWDIVAPAVKKAMAGEGKPPKADPAWEKFVGTYEWFDGSVMKVMLLNGRLTLVDPASPSPWEDRVRLDPVSEGVFRMMDPSQEGETVRFDESEAGEITRIIMPGYSLKRVD
jgi:CubicO group peptidase (beta-lactamase class C family)